MHTPGPWEVYDDWYIKSVTGKGNHACVCNPLSPVIADEEHKANAALIADAPKMLELMRRMYDSVEKYGEGGWEAFNEAAELLEKHGG